MAVERAIYIVILCFFALGSATICRYSSECNQLSGESCCSDSVCRKTCFYCSFDSDCGTEEECCDGGDCSSDCRTWTEASIAGVVVGTIVFFAIIISIVACCCCACCPFYRYRSPGTVVTSQSATHQPYLSTTHMAMTAQQVQGTNYNQPPPENFNRHPPQRPPPPNYNQPSTSGYDQAPPPYNPDYPRQLVQYPPPPA